jgi:uncharacterized protein (DUF697 family)
LINSIFGKELAKTGTGRPVTQHYVRYDDPNVFVNIYDSKGWEGGTKGDQIFYEDTSKFLTQYEHKPVEDKIHIIWYCIPASGHRFEAYEEKLARDYFQDIPILFVLTKGDGASDESIDALREEIEKAKIPNTINIIDVCANPAIKRGKPVIEPYGLDTVVSETVERLPELVRRAFISAQKVNLELKAKEAKKTIIGFISGAAITGMSPIPFSDALILVPLQATMIARIAIIYGLKSKDMVMASVAGLVSSFTATVVGQGLANLIKFIPGIGTLIGGVINATVASSLTATIGFSFRALFHEIIKRVIVGEDNLITENWMIDFMKDKLNRVFTQINGSGTKAKAEQFDDIN